MKEDIINSARDLARNFLYYDRKECEDLKMGDIQKAVETGEITKEEIIEAFRTELDSWW